MPQSTKTRKRTGKKKVRISVDFPSAEAALEWFDALRREGHFPAESDLFQQDGIDRSSAGVTDKYTFIVRRGSERPAHHLLRNAGKKKPKPAEE